MSIAMQIRFAIVVFMVTLSTAHVESDLEEERGAVSLLQRNTRVTSALRPQDRLSVFCWMVETPYDLTAKLARNQLQQCDDYLVFSNYSNTALKTLNLFNGDEMIVGDVYGWANTARLIGKAYHALIQSNIPDQHHWLVKIDPDSFFRPWLLRPILAQYDAHEPCLIGRPPIGPREKSKRNYVSGPMEIVSYKAFRANKSSMILTAMNQTGNEDTQLSQAFRWAGWKIIAHQRWDQCYKMSFSYENLPKDRHLPHAEWDTSIIPNVLRELMSDLNVRCKNVGVVDGWNMTIHRDVVVAHPVKDVRTYAELQRLDALSRAQRR